MSDSPLAEASSDSLEVLFNRDPLNLSDADVTRIREEFRRIRKRLAEAPPKAAKAEKKATISMDDII